MYYYFIEGRKEIFERENAIDIEVYPQFVELTEEEREYYLEHPGCNKNDINKRNYVPPVDTGMTFQEAVEKRLNMLYDYDSSNAINEFYIMGIPMWLDKATRTGLLLRIQAESAVGRTETTLWSEEQSFTLPITAATQMLYAIEIYASECYDNTARHAAAIKAMTDMELIFAYDFTTGYPSKLHFMEDNNEEETA